MKKEQEVRKYIIEATGGFSGYLPVSINDPHTNKSSWIRINNDDIGDFAVMIGKALGLIEDQNHKRSSTEKIISDFGNLELDKADKQTLLAIYSAANNMMLEASEICRQRGIEL